MRSQVYRNRVNYKISKMHCSMNDIFKLGLNDAFNNISHIISFKSVFTFKQ
jgi:hypothetical protein